MTHWAEASRLSNALRERSQVGGDIDQAEAWDRLRPLLDGAPTARTDRRGPRRGVVAGSMLAGVAALVIAVLVVGVTDRDDRRVRNLAPIDAPEPELLVTDGSCSNLASRPTEYRSVGAAGTVDMVAAQGVDVASARAARTIWAVAGENGANSSEAFERLRSPLPPLDVVLHVRVSADLTLPEWEQALRGIRQAVACPISPVAVIVASTAPEVADLVAAALCSDVSDIAYGGSVLVGPAAAPPSCPPRKPVVLIEPTDDRRAPEDWARRHGCSDPSVTVDDRGHRVTRWSRCDVTLIHVGLTVSDPWTTTVEGTPMPEFVRSIASLAF